MFHQLKMWLTLFISLSILFVVNSQDCQFPIEWRGQWYQLGFPQVNITSTTIGEGRCLEHRGIRYLIQETTEDHSQCYRCWVIFFRHHNVIQFKQNFICDHRDELSVLCRDIDGDALLHTLWRIDAIPTVCPFKNAYTFSYQRSGEPCEKPISRVDACADPSRKVLRYQACPDIRGTEQIDEKLQCFSTWRVGNARFMYGRIVSPKVSGYKHRCFQYERFSDGGRSGYYVAMSGDETCTGFQSARDGPRMMTFYDELHDNSKCLLPDWVTQHHQWHSINSKQNYHINHKNSTIRITNINSNGDDSSKIRITCSNILESTSDFVVFVGKISFSCSSGYQCVAIIKRNQYVLELDRGLLVHTESSACRTPYFNSNSEHYVTLVSGIKKKSQLCPSLVPRSNDSQRSKREATCKYGSVSIGCGASDLLQIGRSSICNEEERHDSKAFRCLGSWHDNSTRYIIATELEGRNRVCLTSSYGNNWQLRTTCSINELPLLTLNVTVNNKCRGAEEASMTGTATMQSTTAFAFLLVLLLLATR